MELCSRLFDSLDGRGVWGRMDTCICMAESFRPSPETVTTLLISYIPIQNKTFKNQSASAMFLSPCNGDWWQVAAEWDRILLPHI